MLSTYLANKLLDHAIGRTAFPMPANVFLAAFTAPPSPDGGGTEAAWIGYGRVQISALMMSPAAAGISTNNLAINFSTNNNATASVTVSHLATFDAAAGGNLLEFFPLRELVSVPPGSRLAIAAGDLIRRAVAEPEPEYTPGLGFSDPRNSQFIPAIAA